MSGQGEWVGVCCGGVHGEIKRESGEQSGADAIKSLGHRSPCQASV